MRCRVLRRADDDFAFCPSFARDVCALIADDARAGPAAKPIATTTTATTLSRTFKPAKIGFLLVTGRLSVHPPGRVRLVLEGHTNVRPLI
jgi:hypothetical protein